MGWTLWWVLQGFCVGIGTQAGYTLGQWRGTTGSGFLVAWVVAVGFNSVGIG